MLVWQMEIEHNWTVKAGLYGRGMKKWLRRDLWVQLAATYTGSKLDENWQALFQSITLFRKASIEVGQRLGYSYPDQLDKRVLAYLHRVKHMNHL